MVERDLAEWGWIGAKVMGRMLSAKLSQIQVAKMHLMANYKAFEVYLQADVLEWLTNE